MAKTILLCADCEGTHRQLADTADLIERLLSPSEATWAALPFALALYALRLGLVWLGPAITAWALTSWLLRWWSPRPRSFRPRSTPRQRGEAPPTATTSPPSATPR